MSFAQPFTDYEILARVGAGAMGTVFRARQKKLNRIVALKVLRPSLARDTHYVDRLRREARIVASLNHPNIVAGYDVGEEGGYHFFVMEYFEGPSLRSLLSEWGMFPEQQVLDTAIQVVEALDHAYQRGVIHRDIKPGNILINDRGEVKLTDMGLAKGPADLALTRDGATVGTPQYISPEQARTPQEVDIRSDLYSLGATLYHMATGQTPFSGDSMAEVITKLLQERAPSATDLNPKLSDGLSLVIRKLMAKDPDLRYQTPRELLDDLHRVQREEDPEVDLQRLEAAEVTPPSAVKRRVAIGVAFALVIASSIWVGSLVRGTGDDGLSREEFARRLERELQAEETFRDRLEFLYGAELASESQSTRDVVAGLKRRELDRMNQEVEEAFEASEAELATWLAEPGNWRDPDGWIRDVLAPRLAQRFGYATLPSEEPLDSLEAVRQSVRERADQRDKSYLRDLDRYLQQDFQRDYRMRLAEADFKGAEAGLDNALAAWFADGRPSREQLREGLRVEVNARLTRAREEARAVIAEAENQVVTSLENQVSARLESVAEDLANPDLTPDFDLLREQLGNLRTELEHRYPPPEKFWHDPWPGVSQRIGSTLGDISLREQNLQSQQLGRLLSLAYSTLARQGDFQGARGWLDTIDVESVVLNDRLDRHETVLLAAEAVAETILGTLSGLEGLTVHRRVDPNRELTLVVEEESGQFRVKALTPAGTEIASSLVDVQFSDLLEQALARRPDLLDEVPNAHQGVALCLFLSNEFVEAPKNLSSDERNFFAEEIWPRLERVFEERDLALTGEGGRAMQDLLLAETRARQGGSITVLRRTLNEFLRRFPAVAEENAKTVGEIETFLLDAEGRSRVEEDLRAASLPGAEIRLDQSMQATVTYPLQALQEIELPQGWSVGEDALGFQLIDVPLSRALELELALPLPLPGNGGVEFTARLQFPPVGNEPRLWLFECNGVGLVLGLLADDSVAAAIVAAEDLANPGDLREVLQQPMADAAKSPRAFVIPGAIHELSLKIGPDPSGNRLSAEARLDTNALFTGPASIAARRRTGGPRGEIGIVPTQPLAILQVQLSGNSR